MHIFKIRFAIHSIESIYCNCYHKRYLMSQSSHKQDNNQSALVKSLLKPGSIIVSKSKSIYENLAIEEWFYRNYDFSRNNNQILLIWLNNPCIVIGRHQNLWLECSLDYCKRNNVSLARRNSGGGAVYHDLNNLNISFMTSRRMYNRNKNLQFLSYVLKDCFKIDASINTRKDLIVDNRKISGTASKLNSHNSYHHCTLLVDVDHDQLKQSIRLGLIKFVETNATRSVPSLITNLSKYNQSLTTESLIDAIKCKYHSFYYPDCHFDSDLVFHKLDPSCVNDEHFRNGIRDIRSMFQSWQWIYGATPKFNILQKLIYNSVEYQIKLTIERGHIQQFNIEPPIEPEWRSRNFEPIIGLRFEDSDLKAIVIDEDQPLIRQVLIAIYSAYKNMTID